MLSNYKFVNTQEFRRTALFFEKYGHYEGNEAPSESPDWEAWWDREINRCLNGYSVGGVKITGYHYHYLNFCPIPLVRENFDVTGEKGNTADWGEGFPAFWDGDYNYFWACEIARYGVTPEFRKILEPTLGVNILYWDGGKHMVTLKARGQGYSLKSGSMFSRDYHLIRGSRSYAMAAKDDYLTKGDALLNKTWNFLDHASTFCPWGHPRAIDKMMHKMAGGKDNDTGAIEGFKSQIIGVICDQPLKARGKRGGLIKYEEAGAFPNLIKLWETNRPSVEQGKFTVGLMEAFGTGGESGTNFEGLEELFYNPDAYNVLPFENIWDGGGDKAGWFVPDYMNRDGFMDKDGNSDIEATKEHEQKERDAKKNSPNLQSLYQHIAEHCWTPQEACLQADVNHFPLDLIKDWRARLATDKRLKYLGVPGKLYRDSGVIFKPDYDLRPVTKFPHSKADDLTGCVVIYEKPYHENGKVPRGLYYLWHDPYANDEIAESNLRPSLGTTYVYKRINDYSKPDDCIVASFNARINPTEEYNRILFMLAEYYNTYESIAFENDRGDVIKDAKYMKQTHWLQPEFDILSKGDDRRTLKRRWGGSMSGTNRKTTAARKFADWLITSNGGSDGEGDIRLNLHLIYDIALLDEILKWNLKGNFDRVSACMIGMGSLNCIYDVPVEQPVDDDPYSFFNRPLFV